MPVRNDILNQSSGGLLLTFIIISLIMISLSYFDVPRAESIQPPVAIDYGLVSGFQDTFSGHHNRSRALLAADFDLDGRIDFYIGNPGDESFVMRNVALPGGQYRFERVQVLLTGALAWGAVVADFDNDGDYDIFIACGGNEGEHFDYLFRNDFIETGVLHFTDVTDSAGVSGPVPPLGQKPVQTASANARLADYDQDGDIDIFVNTNFHFPRLGFFQRVKRKVMSFFEKPKDIDSLQTKSGDNFTGRNILWRNDGNLRFTDVTNDVGLGITFRQTRHSTWLDYDNDGDMDLYENNMRNLNVLWRNLLVETGEATFKDVTDELSLPGENLAYPINSFVSAATDFNNDGWEDLLVLFRAVPGKSVTEHYNDGHAIFMNQQGNGFKNVALNSGINNGLPPRLGVMGCQVGDISGDGYPDIYLGNGGPKTGLADRLFLSATPGDSPTFIEATQLIDYPAPELPRITYPPYPYRTHGTTFVDVNGDGILEIAVVNGGPSSMPDEMREPNRFFHLNIDQGHFFKVKLKGDSKHVSADAIGARLALIISDGGSNPRTLYRTLYGGSCFSAHNGFSIHFGLGSATQIDSLTIIWPDNHTKIIDTGLKPDSTLVVNY